MQTPTVPPLNTGGLTPRRSSSGARAAAALAAAADPEWLPLLALLLAPAGLCAALGAGQKASFFLGTAVYVACLKWLGWATFGRLTASRPRSPLFPAELFAGLAVACAWFYIRNLVARAWPASYGLGELAWLFPALVLLHAAALVVSWRRHPWPGLAALGLRLAPFVPFVLVLTAALWSISAALGVQGSDSMTYTFLARAYRAGGTAFALPPTFRPIVYPSGFGAMNATAAALTPLSVLQALNLQHVLLCVAAPFLVTTTVAALARRPLAALHWLPVAFLFVFPLYALYPDVLYPGTPKQAGPPLCAAVCLLPLLAPVAGRVAFFVAAGVIAFLAVLAAALNPACGPYALVAALVAVVILAARGRTALGLPIPLTVAALTGLGLTAAGLVCACDLYYGPMLRHSPAAESGTGTGTGTGTGGTADAPPRFSWAKAVGGLGWVNPISLSPVESTTALNWGPAEPLRGWGDRWPAATFPILALGLPLLALAGLLSPRTRAAVARDPIVRLLLAAVALWLGLKYAMTFLLAGLSRSEHMTGLLSVYLRYLLLRCELLLLFTGLAAACARLFLIVEARSGQAARRASVAAAVGCGLLPALGLLAGVLVSGFPIILTTDRFEPTANDIKLSAWLADNVPPNKGNIALAAFTFRASLGDVEQYIIPLEGGHAVALYDPHYNFRFAVPALEDQQGVAAYRQHVGDTLDLRWCRENEVRYFYVPAKGLAENPGLDAAVRDGRLRPLRREGDSCVYELTEGAAP
jgi:hypothetical protein